MRDALHPGLCLCRYHGGTAAAPPSTWDALRRRGGRLRSRRVHAAGALAGQLALALAVWSTVDAIGWALLLAVAGWALADLASGLYHLLLDHLPPQGDTYLRRQAAAFQVHHHRPGAFLEGGLLAAALPSAAPAMLAGVLALCLPGPWPALLWAFGAGIYAAQIAHGIAHLRPAWARPPQRARLLLRPAEHDAHHADTGGTYCVLTGWCNPILDRLAAATRAA